MSKWRFEKVSPPAQFTLPKTEAFRDNYDRIFRPKILDEDVAKVMAEVDRRNCEACRLGVLSHDHQGD